MTDTETLGGTLVLVVGASGVGKDTVLRGARAALADDAAFVFPTRYITRPPDESEAHAQLDEREWGDLVARGCVSLHWKAHGLSYALPKVVDEHLSAGRVVICNVSRTVIEAARLKYGPAVIVLEIRASQENRAARLAARKRESLAEIAARLTRVVDTEAADTDYVVTNDGHPDAAIDAFVKLLRFQTRSG